MGYCKTCKVKILDDTDRCPLCGSVLKNDGDETDLNGPISRTYPDIFAHKKKLNLTLRIVGFLAIAVSLVSIFLNYNLNGGLKGFYWSLIVVGSLLYAFSILRLIAIEAGYIRQMLSGTIGGVLLVVWIDVLTGFHRWSINFVLPGSMLLVDLAFIIFMIINRKNWSGYMLYQLLMIVIALIPFILIMTHVVTHPIVSEIAILSAILVFLGTLILGGAAARTEIQRRFFL
ncbi:MAG: DUF6320 domain-containing protein [Lachnospiraceae bacterium]|nr:DUF6320 domain-containing protein [Lachnospiraceae bacterium]MDD6578224.1 DUF6320 domain-containing protein [Lachnospiraceae bacterium]